MLDRDVIIRVQHALNPLLGRPWQRGATGPAAFDCWGLALHLQRVLAGRELPPLAPIDATPAALAAFLRDQRPQWRQIERPAHLCLAELAHARHPHHIGTYLDIDGGGIAHCHEGAGVTFDSLPALKGAGWLRMRFHDFAA